MFPIIILISSCITGGVENIKTFSITSAFERSHNTTKTKAAAVPKNKQDEGDVCGGKVRRKII